MKEHRENHVGMQKYREGDRQRHKEPQKRQTDTETAIEAARHKIDIVGDSLIKRKTKAHVQRQDRVRRDGETETERQRLTALHPVD